MTQLPFSGAYLDDVMLGISITLLNWYLTEATYFRWQLNKLYAEKIFFRMLLTYIFSPNISVKTKDDFFSFCLRMLEYDSE